MKRLFFPPSPLLSFFQRSGRIAPLLAAFFLAACAGPSPVTQQSANYPVSKDDRLRHIIEMQNRLDRVAGALQIANAELCRDQIRNLLGFSAMNKYSYSKTMIPVASQSFGMGERLMVTNVVPDSGAQKAGLERGDILISIEGKPVPQGPAGENETVKMLAPIVVENTAVKMTVERNGATHKLTIPLTRACGFRVELGHTDHANAISDGQRILITRGMMRFAQNDNELAYVIGKEMAHNVLNHAKTLQTTETNQKIIDNLMQMTPSSAISAYPTKSMPKQFDLDSDTLGLVMALRAGYEIDPAVDFWTRFTHSYPASASTPYRTAHPNNRARLELMPKSITRIKSAEKRRKAAPGKQ